MTVIQENHWTCDVCGAQGVTRVLTSAWSDPVVHPPDAWRSDFEIPAEIREHPCLDVCDACPACVASPDWTRFKSTAHKTDAS